jgi:hypothetical protein
MNRRFGFSRRSKLVVVASSTALLLLMVVGVALALGITVDGQLNPADEWGVNAETCTIGSAGCSRVIDDGRDVSGPPTDWYDLENVHVTNDPNNLYVRLDYFGDNGVSHPVLGYSNTWKITTSGRPLLTICFDIDASGTGSSNGATGSDLPPGYCNGGETMYGVDYVVQIIGRSTGSPTIPKIYHWDLADGPTWQDVFVNQTPVNGTVGYVWGGGALTEIGLPLTNLGFDPINHAHQCPLSWGPQPCSYRMSMYYDNGVDASDDSVPNSGMATSTFGCDLVNGCSPTAVTFNRFEAKPDTQNNTAALILVGSVVVALALLGVVMIRHRHTA